MLFFTDPQRTPDPAATIAALPRGSAVVYRAFGRDDAIVLGQPLRDLARRRGVLFLVGADERLAASLKADGLHLPERMIGRLQRLRARHRGWRLTVAAHNRAALRSALRNGADAAVLSPIFPSRSPSAGAPIGTRRLASLVRGSSLPVYALGGVSAATAPRLARTGVSGLAAVEALLAPAKRPS